MEKQNYRKIELNTLKETFLLNEHEIVVFKLKGYKNIYVSSNCHIKPKGLHIVLKNINEAIKDFKIDDDTFKVIIFSYKDGLNIFGTYRAITNEIYLNEAICDVDKLRAEKLEIGHIERHEVWHLKQALNYKKKFKIINKQNYSDYIKYTNRQAKKYIDYLGVNEDNVGEISEYAYNSFSLNRYDEIEAEIKAKKGAKKCYRFTQKKWKNYLNL